MKVDSGKTIFYSIIVTLFLVTLFSCVFLVKQWDKSKQNVDELPAVSDDLKENSFQKESDKEFAVDIDHDKTGEENVIFGSDESLKFNENDFDQDNKFDDNKQNIENFLDEENDSNLNNIIKSCSNPELFYYFYTSTPKNGNDDFFIDYFNKSIICGKNENILFEKQRIQIPNKNCLKHVEEDSINQSKVDEFNHQNVREFLNSITVDENNSFEVEPVKDDDKKIKTPLYVPKKMKLINSKLSKFRSPSRKTYYRSKSTTSENPIEKTTVDKPTVGPVETTRTPLFKKKARPK